MLLLSLDCHVFKLILVCSLPKSVRATKKVPIICVVPSAKLQMLL